MQKGEKHTANYHVLAVCQRNATLWIAVDNHVARSPLTVWKDNGIQKQHCCQSCFENYKQSKRLNINDKLKHKGERKNVVNYKQASTARKSKLGKNLQQMQAPRTTHVQLTGLFVLHDFRLNDKHGWQAVNIIEVTLTNQNLQVWKAGTHSSSSRGQRPIKVAPRVKW